MSDFNKIPFGLRVADESFVDVCEVPNGNQCGYSPVLPYPIEGQARRYQGMAFCAKQQINVRTFTARLSDYRKLPAPRSEALIPVHIKPSAAADIVFIHAQGHRLELPQSVSARWMVELLRCPG